MARRTMNSELVEGATDGKYRKARMNTSNCLPSNDEATLGDREGLAGEWGYGTFATGKVEPRMYLPDGTTR